MNKEEASYFQSKFILDSNNARIENGELITDEVVSIPKIHIKRYFAEQGINYEEELKNKPRVEVVLPSEGKLISDFAREVADILKDKNEIFFRPSSRDIVEIGKIQEKNKEVEYTGFVSIKPERFITKCEKYFKPVVERRTKYGSELIDKSMDRSMASITLNSSQLQDTLPKIKRIFSVPLPILDEGKLTFPKMGYDPRFQSWLNPNAPKLIEDMKLEEAREIINKIYKEFCFKSEQDKTNAIGSLLTPFCRGLFKSFNTRTPIDVWVANRERAGKDCGAGCRGVLYEGYALEEPPISSGENSGNNNEELRKKLLSALIAGRKMLHFSNNKGHLDNSVLEGFATSETFSDRALGRNEILTFDNEIDLSLSGNVGISYTPDIANRCKFINLFLDIEDANARQFENPNLHQWIKENRALILSSLYTLVRTWVEAGMPNGNIPFASFPEWSRVIGGIMESCGYNNPCVPDKEMLALGGDSETKEMKSLFELCYERYPNQWISKADIRNLIINGEDGIFGYLDFNKKSDQTKFGQKITKFLGRVLSGIRLNVKDMSVRASRQEFMFVKEEQDKDSFGNLGNLGNLYTPIHIKNNLYIGVGETIPRLPGLPEKDLFEAIKLLNEQFGALVPKEMVVKLGGFENIEQLLDKLKRQGLILEPKQGFIQIV